MDLELNSKKVLITGGSRGIGYAIASHFLTEGANVFIVSRNEEKLKIAENKLSKKFGQGRVWSRACDCGNPIALKKLYNDITEKFGLLDIVICNVGDGQGASDAIPEDSHWEKIWNTNFESALFTSRTFLPMLKDSKGVLLFISSIAAKEVIGAPVDYSTAKAAIIAFSKNLSRKIGESVRVNVIAPGNINFEGGSWDKKIKKDSKKVEEIIRLNVPMKRFGTPEEIADAAIFICSQRASFINGSVLVVDGGQTIGIL